VILQLNAFDASTLRPLFSHEARDQHECTCMVRKLNLCASNARNLPLSHAKEKLIPEFAEGKQHVTACAFFIR